MATQQTIDLTDDENIDIHALVRQVHEAVQPFIISVDDSDEETDHPNGNGSEGRVARVSMANVANLPQTHRNHDNPNPNRRSGRLVSTANVASLPPPNRNNNSDSDDFSILPHEQKPKVGQKFAELNLAFDHCLESFLCANGKKMIRKTRGGAGVLYECKNGCGGHFCIKGTFNKSKRKYIKPFILKEAEECCCKPPAKEKGDDNLGEMEATNKMPVIGDIFKTRKSFTQAIHKAREQSNRLKYKCKNDTSK